MICLLRNREGQFLCKVQSQWTQIWRTFSVTLFMFSDYGLTASVRSIYGRIFLNKPYVWLRYQFKARDPLLNLGCHCVYVEALRITEMGCLPWNPAFYNNQPTMFAVINATIDGFYLRRLQAVTSAESTIAQIVNNIVVDIKEFW